MRLGARVLSQISLIVSSVSDLAHLGRIICYYGKDFHVFSLYLFLIRVLRLRSNGSFEMLGLVDDLASCSQINGSL